MVGHEEIYPQRIEEIYPQIIKMFRMKRIEIL
jgi:hypothetical protein